MKLDSSLMWVVATVDDMGDRVDTKSDTNGLAVWDENSFIGLQKTVSSSSGSS